MTYAMSEVKTKGARSLHESHDPHQGSTNPDQQKVTHIPANTSVLSPFDVPEHLSVSQELPEVDVEHVTAGLQHDVVVVAIADSQDVGCHAAAGARVDEVLHRLDTHAEVRGQA